MLGNRFGLRGVYNIVTLDGVGVVDVVILAVVDIHIIHVAGIASFFF